MTLNSRLYRPPVSKSSVFRNRLNIEFLDNSYSIYLIVGSAGYGKTELVSQWVELTNRKCCWISLDERHDNLKNVIYDLGICLLHLGYKQGDTFVSISENIAFPKTEFLLERFENVFYSVKEPVVLVFDDLHLVSNKTVKDFLLSVSMIFSRQITKSLVLISRHINDLDYSYLVNYNKICITTTEQLKFGLEETNELIVKRNFKNSYSGLAHELQKKCEGWILLMNYMASTTGLSEDNRSRLTIRKESFTTLINKEWDFDSNGLKEKFRLLCFTHKFNKKLYIKLNKTLDNRFSSQEISEEFDKLVDTIPFIIPLDDKRHWFRLHHYIQEQFLTIVKQRYAPEILNEVINVTADFFEGSNLIEDALLISSTHEHHLKSAEIVKKRWIERLNFHQLNVLEYWISFIPELIQIRHLELIYIRTILHDLYNDGTSILRELDLAEILLKDVPAESKLWGNYNILKSMGQFYTKDFQSSLFSAEKGLKLVPTSSTWFTGFGLVYYLMSLNYLSSQEETEKQLHKNHVLPSENIIDRMNKNIILASNYLILGDFKMVLLLSKSVSEVARHEKHYVVYVMANYFIAKILYLQNRVDEALMYINEILDQEYDARPLWIIHCYWLKLLCLKASYSSSGIIDDKIKEFELYINRYSNPFYKNYKALVDLEIALTFKRQPMASLQQPDFNILTPTIYLFFPEIIEIRSNIFNSHFEEALRLINYYENQLPYPKNYLFFIRLRICKVICLNNLNKKDSGLKLLEAVLIDTEKNKIIQEYLRYDGYLYSLFKELPENIQSHPYIKHIINLIQAKGELEVKKPPKLNNKELEILQLIKLGLINKEIADRLNLSHGTVKTYIYNLYKKLKVKNRKEAIAVFKNLTH